MDKQELRGIRAMLRRYRISNHQALLNNCTDNDEAILHRREIEKDKSRGTD